MTVKSKLPSPLWVARGEKNNVDKVNRISSDRSFFQGYVAGMDGLFKHLGLQCGTCHCRSRLTRQRGTPTLSQPNLFPQPKYIYTRKKIFI